MLLFDAIKKKINNHTEVIEAQVSENVSNAIMDTVKNRTVLGDILDCPQAYKLEAYLDGDGIAINIRPREGVTIVVKK